MTDKQRIVDEVRPAEKKGERPSDKLSPETLLEMYWFMILSRRLDERAWVLHRQGRIAFHISAMGHEACQVAAAFAINRGVDYVAPYYRDISLMLAIGMTPKDFIISLFGKEGEISSKARQMPSHFSIKHLNVISTSAPVATQVPHAAGLAFGINYKLKQGLQENGDTTQPRLALSCLGEGSTSQGEWHEAMNWAGVHKLPFICLVQNNQYAISVPLEKQMAVTSIAERAGGYGIKGVAVDGNNILASYDALAEAAQRAYNGEGTTLVEAITYRPVPHSSDDDDRSYRSREEVEEWKKKDPILNYQKVLMERGILTQEMIDDYDARARAEVDKALKEAEALPYPPGESAIAPVYAEVENS